MRRIEELILEIRRDTENELPTAGDTTLGGISDESIIHYLNRAQERLFSKLFVKFPNNFITIATADTVSGTEAYAIGTDVYLTNTPISVEYLTSGTAHYAKLPQASFNSRYTAVNGVPQWYILDDGTVRLNPIPNESKTNGLRLTYYKKPRTLDKRRGYVGTATKSGTTLTSLTLTNPSSLLTKDADLDVAANTILTTVDYVCIVDKNGTAVLEGIAVDSYNTSTRVLTMSSGVTTSISAATLQSNYIVAGKYATSHSELADAYERYLIAYADQAILRRDGNQLEAGYAMSELSAIEEDIREAAAVNTDVFETPIDEHWISEREEF